MVLGDDLMIQVESFPPKVIKSMSKAMMKVGEMDSPEKTAGKAQRVAEDVRVHEGMSIVSQLISLGILGQRSMKEEEDGLSVVEPQLEVEGGVQAISEVEDLWKMLAAERVQEKM